ncbi:MAG: hypothetical protein RLZZ403_633 [Pseudomonadota bacterium]|jgi:hypothetical protein
MSDIVERLGVGICEGVCKSKEARSGCECAEARDEIVRLRTLYEREHAYGYTQTQLLSAAEAERDRLRDVVVAADAMRVGIREAGVKREPKLYVAVMAFDAARAALRSALSKGDTP